MRIRKHDCLIITLVAPLFLAACADKDVYNPDKVRPVAPVENPLGEDFVAPDGFDWSMITTVKLNVEVKDEFNGQYNYLIEVFTSNPLSDKTATPLAAGYAKSGNSYITEISIPKNCKQVFVRQTDPNQRKEIYQYTIPENGGTLNCKLYYATTTTRTETSESTSAYEAAKQAGIIEPEVPDYKDNIDVPSKSDQPTNDWGSGMTFDNGAKYIITENYTEISPFTKDIQVNGRMSIYVKGTWKISTTYYAFDIYVLDGGKIISDNGLTFDNKPNLTIAPKGLLNIKGTFSFQCSKIVNFGTIKAASLINPGSAGEFYNNGAIETTNQIALNKTTFFNCNKLETPQLNLVDAAFVNKADLNVKGNISMNGGTLFNSANISFNNEPSGQIWTNNGTGTRIINHDKAQIKGYAVNTGLALYNDGTIEVFNFNSGGSGDLIYNACMMIIKNNFSFRDVTLNHGSITAGLENEAWMPTPTISNENDAKFNLLNGSIIKARTLTIKSGNNRFIGGNTGTKTNKSMIKAQLIKYNWTTHLEGNLVVEGTPDYSQANNNADCLKSDQGIIQTGFDESKYEIETCGGIINEGNSGDPDPVDPPKPDTGDNTIYTYAFEDQWPAYGDFDMNDIVITIDKMNITDGKKLTIQGNVRAVGSSRKTGVGIQFLDVSSSGVTLSGKVQNGSPAFESGQDHPVVILCTNAHKYCNPSIADDNFTFYCTDPTAGSTYNGNGAAFEIAMTFSTTEEAMEAIKIKNIDVFIISKESQENTGRTEIHLPNYAPTQLATTTLFGMSNDASARNNMLNVNQKGYYISTEGLAWGICIPSTDVWKYPKERKMITDVYPDFKGWVTSGGANNTDWISNHNNDIFIKP